MGSTYSAYLPPGCLSADLAGHCTKYNSVLTSTLAHVGGHRVDIWRIYSIYSGFAVVATIKITSRLFDSKPALKCLWQVWVLLPKPQSVLSLNSAFTSRLTSVLTLGYAISLLDILFSATSYGYHFMVVVFKQRCSVSSQRILLNPMSLFISWLWTSIEDAHFFLFVPTYKLTSQTPSIV